MIQLFDWLRSRPIVSLLLAVFTLWGYSNIYAFGFLVNVPPAVRPFFDAYFFANISIEFFSSLAVSIAIGRALVLLFLYSLKSVHPNFAKTIYWFWPLTNVLEVPGQRHFKTGRKASIAARIAAKWIAKQNFYLTNCLALIAFAFLFLERQSLWFVPVAVLSLPALWVVISRVELRRDFATVKNSKGISRKRVVSSLVTLVLVHLAVVSFIAGLATFQKRISNQASIGVGAGYKNSSLLAVTSSGIVVGNYVPKDVGARKAVSAYFLPFEAISSVGQKF